MMQTGTDPRLTKLRKNESILVISGFGVIAFGMWSVIRAAIYYFLNPLDVANYIQESELDELMEIGREEGVEVITNNMGTLITVFILTALTVDLLLRVYVGLSARRDGRRLRKSGFYILVVWFMAISMFTSIVTTIDNFITPIIQAFSENADAALEETGKSGDQAASVSIIVDITSLLVLLELGVCSLRVRSLRKKLGIKPVKRRKKGEKLEIGAEVAEALKAELNVPMNKQEIEELTEEVGQQLSDGLSSITGVSSNTGE